MTADDRIAALERELAQLKASIGSGRSDGGGGAEAPAATVDRRKFFRAGAVGAAAVATGLVATAKPASAADNDNLVLGVANSATSQTNLTKTGSADEDFVTIDGANPGRALLSLFNTATESSQSHAALTLTAFTTSLPGVGSGNTGSLAPVITDTGGSETSDGFADLFFAHSGDDKHASVDGTWGKVHTSWNSNFLSLITPFRKTDTRGGTKPAGRESRIIDLAADAPPDAIGMLFNVTIAENDGSGYLSVEPGDASGTPATSTINANPEPNTPIANSSMIKFGDGQKIRVYTRQPMHFVIDVLGWIRTGDQVGPGPVNPQT